MNETEQVVYREIEEVHRPHKNKNGMYNMYVFEVVTTTKTITANLIASCTVPKHEIDSGSKLIEIKANLGKK